MGEAYKVVRWKTPLGMEEWVWHKGGLIRLSELLFAENLIPKMNMPPNGIGIGSDVLAFPVIRPGVYGELPMLDHERWRRIKRSLDALYADQPIKLSPAEWKQIVEEQE